MKRVKTLIKSHPHLLLVILCFFLFSIAVIWVNQTFYHYPGNYYFPQETPSVFLILIFIYIGCRLWLGQTSLSAQKALEVIFLFATIALIALGCNAIQYTPFEPIDTHIITWSEWLHLDLATLMQWTNQHPTLLDTMRVLYESIVLQMTYLPLILILCGVFERVREYCFLLLITGLLGYVFYYFYPTTAPASVMQSPHFTTEQYATGIKFYQIHNHINPTTIEGGMIALPSFHVIWAWLCTYLVRDWKYLFVLTGLINLGIVCSCVLLGWHYILDVIGSVVVIGMGHYVYMKCYPRVNHHTIIGTL